MGNAEYQALLRLPAGAARKTVITTPAGETDRRWIGCSRTCPTRRSARWWPTWAATTSPRSSRPTRRPAQPRRGPCVILADTIKGWGYPFAADQMNHGALLTQRQLDELRESLGVAAGDEWAGFPAGSAEAGLMRAGAAP